MAETSCQHKAERSQPQLQKGLSTSKGKCSGACYCCASCWLLPGASSKLHLPPLFGKVLNYWGCMSRESTRDYQVPISHRSLMRNSLMVQKFTSSGAEVTTVYLYHERVAPNLEFKIFLFFSFLSFNQNLSTDLNFLLLLSSAWLMHEGKGPKMALCHHWSAGDLLSFPRKLASGCPR